MSRFFFFQGCKNWFRVKFKHNIQYCIVCSVTHLTIQYETTNVLKKNIELQLLSVVSMSTYCL